MKGEKNVGWQPETQPKGKPPVEKTRGAETTQRLIDADMRGNLIMTKQEILDYLDNVLHPIVSPDNWNVYSELYDMIEELPSAEPVKRGQWIKADSQQYFRKHYPCFTCSECGYRKDSQKTWNYCPNCGARMDEK